MKRILIDLPYWWERSHIVDAAIDRCPGDRLANAELAFLVELRDSIFAEFGDVGVEMMEACAELGVPQ